MKILVLGSKGMLGHVVHKYLDKDTIHKTEIINYWWPTKSFREFIINWKGDYIINCIGSIPQKTNNFAVNCLLPIWLDQNASARIIHPGTDCEMDNDQYGISKKKASDWIKQKGKRTKIIKTSIIGPELNSNYSLMEWFLSQEKEINGYSEFYWNGNTTYTWAEYCLSIMENWNGCKIETILRSKPISKYKLLKILKTSYNKDIKINKVPVPVVNKCLLNGIKTGSIKDQLKVLKEWYAR